METAATKPVIAPAGYGHWGARAGPNVQRWRFSRQRPVVGLTPSGQGRRPWAACHQRALGFELAIPSVVPLRFGISAGWNRALTLAKLPTSNRLGCHALRPQVASELRHVPLRDLCDLGGWRSAQTVLTYYQMPDAEAQREAIGKRRELRAGAQK